MKEACYFIGLMFLLFAIGYLLYIFIKFDREAYDKKFKEQYEPYMKGLTASDIIAELWYFNVQAIGNYLGYKSYYLIKVGHILMGLFMLVIGLFFIVIGVYA